MFRMLVCEDEEEPEGLGFELELETGAADVASMTTIVVAIVGKGGRMKGMPARCERMRP